MVNLATRATFFLALHDTTQESSNNATTSGSLNCQQPKAADTSRDTSIRHRYLPSRPKQPTIVEPAGSWPHPSEPGRHWHARLFLCVFSSSRTQDSPCPSSLSLT